MSSFLDSFIRTTDTEKSTINTVDESSFFCYDLQTIKSDIKKFVIECGLRNLNETKKW